MLKSKSLRIKLCSLLMDSDQLSEVASKLEIKDFVGVFPLDRLPRYLRMGSRLIVNTDTHNLPGQHWIGVIFDQNGMIKAFDPLGFFYPPALREYLRRQRARKLWFNHIMYQKPGEATCGIHVLNWLNRYKHT